MAERPKIKFNPMPPIPPPVTEEDFLIEMAGEALTDLVIQGRTTLPNGIRLVMDTPTYGRSIFDQPIPLKKPRKRRPYG